MVEINPVFGNSSEEVKPAPWGLFGKEGGDIEPGAFVASIENFYMTDPISRASVTMALCSEAFTAPQMGRTGTDG